MIQIVLAMHKIKNLLSALASIVRRMICCNSHLKNARFFSKIAIICTSFLMFMQNANAILDGRLTPIFLDTRYTFTNGEWARGTVFFNNGFDVPPNGTAYVSLNGGAVGGSIGLNGGTLVIDRFLRLEGQGYFVSPGFIRSKQNISLNYIYHDSITQSLFMGSGKIKIVGRFEFQGLAKGSRFDQVGCTIDFSESASNLGIAGGIVWWRNVITLARRPPGIYFYNLDLIALNNTFINTSSIAFSGISSITALGLFTVQELRVIGNGKCTIYPKSHLKLKNLEVPFKGTRLELKNSTLDFVSTTTGQINIFSPFFSLGSISVEGECILKSSTNNKLWLDSRADLEILPGSRLLLNPGTSFSIIPLA